MNFRTLLVATALLAAPMVAWADEVVRPLPPMPQVTLPVRDASGQRAIDLLAGRLPAVAAAHGKSAADFRDMLLHDDTLHIDQHGQLFAVEKLAVPLAPRPASVIDGRLAPLNQTFLLHSKPDAKRVLVLNFQGATLTNTAWNFDSAPVVAPPFDMDGNLDSFSNDELRRIQYIWQRVAEDYAPFNVDVTTELVPQSRITRSGANDPYYGTVALITKPWWTCGCGGVAYVGIFNATSDYYKPALVFYDALYSDEKYVAEATSHELGHNAGLGHDGTSTSGYYGGQGTGATSWGPIMGAAYYPALSEFSKGDYADANNHEDDFVVMQQHGLPLRADDHGNTPDQATALAGTIAGGVMKASADGVIERRGDADVFSLSAGAGVLTASAVPSKRAANADLVLTLMDATGRVVLSRNPTEAIRAGFKYTVTTPGTYYLKVTATGKGNPLTTGYSDYGSRGMYRLNANYVPAAGSSAVAAVK